MPGRHHTETPPGESRATSFGTLVIVAIAVLAIIAGVATIAAWAAPNAKKDADLATIVVQPSASLPVPTAASDTPTFDPLPSPTASSAGPAASASSPATAAPTTSAAVLVESTSRATPSTAAPAPLVAVTSAAAPTTVAGTSPTAAVTAAPSLATDLTAGYTVTSTTTDGFVADVTVRNATGTAQAWTVVLTYSASTKMTVTGYWNATPAASGRRLTFQGDPLAAGSSYSFGFQAAVDKAGAANLTGCTINGITCAGF